MRLVVESSARLAEFVHYVTRVIRHRARAGLELSLVFIGAKDVFRVVRWLADGSTIYHDIPFQDVLMSTDGERLASDFLSAVLADDGVERTPAHRGPRK